MALFTRPSHSLRPQHFPGQVPIDVYGEGVFRFAEMSHPGSLLCLPSGIYGWPVTDVAEITEESLADVIAEAADVALLVIGCGRDIGVIPKLLRERLKESGIGLEVMPTGAAVRTYNILLAEGRPVAAALVVL
ncbi:membrane protein [Kaistia sp. 32K]|uniref:Mth938-like domain-containing protein n=1 Tax=Kaistia sp. 32K TaxID=2795690 RepID=UPI0019165BF8|nr:MTH938/NDUFAF3 family protein [Kaistia sp. 32K]BCP53182.1 membrane protein [Kaistia sp. 32K]